jgi:hypothetical protein
MNYQAIWRKIPAITITILGLAGAGVLTSRGTELRMFGGNTFGTWTSARSIE